MSAPVGQSWDRLRGISAGHDSWRGTCVGQVIRVMRSSAWVPGEMGLPGSASRRLVDSRH